jgi:large subunit ribosomal protein L18
MKKSNIYTVQYRRKRKGLTDYRRRLKLLVSKKPRLIIRKSLGNINAAVAEYTSKGDVIKAASNSLSLKKLGWKYSTGNIPSAFLVGYIVGKKAINSKIDEAILDIGHHKSVKGSRIYAVLAGAIEAGLKIPHNKEMLPTKDRISGKHIISYSSKLTGTGSKQFKAHSKHNIDLANIEKDFEETKSKIGVKNA